MTRDDRPRSRPTRRDVEQGGRSRFGRSANERFKARYDTKLVWATLIAVAAHVAIFTFSPNWETRVRDVSPSAWQGSRLLALPYFGRAPSLLEGPATPLSIAEGDEEEEAEALLQEGSTVADLNRGDLWDAVGQRLRRGGLLTPSLAEPEFGPDPGRDRGQAGEESAAAAPVEGDPSVGGDAAMADLAVTALEDSLRLDRLSALRPDIAFMTASAWVLIRNPVEVAAYMGRGYRNGTLDGSVTGTVAVTLWIDRGGSVEWAEVSESSGRPDLDEYALELFNEVVDFRPARERGVAISRSVTLSLRFPW